MVGKETRNFHMKTLDKNSISSLIQRYEIVTSVIQASYIDNGYININIEIEIVCKYFPIEILKMRLKTYNVIFALDKIKYYYIK